MYFTFFCTTCQVRDHGISHSNMFIKWLWLSTLIHVWERGSEAYSDVWGAQDQMVNVGEIVDLTDNQAFAECHWIWALFNMTKVALFDFSWLKLMNQGYFKLKLNKVKILSKKLLMLQPYFMLCCGNSAIVCQYQMIPVLSVLTKWIFLAFGTNVVVWVVMKNTGKQKNLPWPNCWVPQFYVFLNLFMSTVTKVLQDPTENVALHCQVQEYLIGQGKGRNDSTINNAWYSSKKYWNFVSRGFSVWKVYIWPNKPQTLGMILLQNLFALFSYCLF